MATVYGAGVYVDRAGHGFPVVVGQSSVVGGLHVIVDGVDGGGLAGGVGDVANLRGEGGRVGVLRRRQVTHGGRGCRMGIL